MSVLSRIGSPSLSSGELIDFARECFSTRDVSGKRVLCVVPDTTRSMPMPAMFRAVCDAIRESGGRVDFLVALGTHPPLSEEVLLRWFGLTATERAADFADVGIFNHAWEEDDALVSIGRLPDALVRELSGGLLSEGAEVRINRRILDYDLLCVAGPVFPHEVVGFSGGNKYFFPGISGPEILHIFHWLAALVTNPQTNGVRDTPVRAVIDAATAMIPVERVAFCLNVVDDACRAIYFGTPEEAWEPAADAAAKTHIVTVDEAYDSVLAICPAKYYDLWVAGKCMYKLEPVVADDGELIIYAPHVDRVSTTHGKLLERIGYHTRDYFLAKMDEYADVPGGILAHSTHVRGIGTYAEGVESPRIRVTLATGISEELCRRINLGYRDPGTIDRAEWESKPGRLIVENAGEILYRLKEGRPAPKPRRQQRTTKENTRCLIMPKNVIIAQSGGPTPVINSSLRGIIETARRYPETFGTIYAGWHGIEGVLTEELLDLSQQDDDEIALLRYTPAAGSIGSCRYKLTSDQDEDFDRVIEVLKAHDIGYFFYIGGNDSMDTANKVSQLARDRGLDLVAVGVPKTIDNDVGDSEFKLIDHTPGYGSVARYWMSIVQNANEENRGSSPSDPVLVLQAMGRKIGYIPAAARLADPNREMPLLIFMAEANISPGELCDRVSDRLRAEGRCMVVVSEGYDAGDLGATTDSFGHVQFSASKTTVAQQVVNFLNEQGLPVRGTARGQVPGTDQRGSAVYASIVDLDEAYRLGQQAVLIAESRESGWMATLLRTPGPVYAVEYGRVPLEKVANSERHFPEAWLSEDKTDVTDAFLDYARPLIGEDWASVPLVDGRQRFTRFRPIFADRKLPGYVPQAARGLGNNK